MSISIADFGRELQKTLNLYSDEITNGMNAVIEDMAEKGLQEIKRQSETAGFNNRVYAQGWSKVIRKSAITRRAGLVLFNKKHYRLTHLLEYGHATRKGGRDTRAFPHISTAQNNIEEQTVKELKEMINNA